MERPLLTVITSISLDHTEILGDTIEQIAAEKAGIIKRGIPVFFDGILSDMKNGKTTTLDKLRERQYGKPTQRMELTGKDGGDLIPARTLTKEEAAELFKTLNEKY